MICKTGDTRAMTTQYDEMGNVIGDDGSYPMEHIMAHAPSMPRPMPLQANGSDVPYVVSEIPQTQPPVQQPVQRTPQTPPPSQSFLERMTLPIQAAITHMPGAAFVQGITPAVQFPFQVASGTAYALANRALNPDTADFNADTSKFMENTTMPAQSKAGQEFGNVLGEIAQRTGPLPELMGLHPALSADDMRVALKQNVERVREIKNIPTDYVNAKSGISRESNLGGKTYGENLKNAAYDIADVAARQAARRSESAPAMTGSVQVFSDLVPDTKQYMMQGPKSALWDEPEAIRAQELEVPGNKTDKEIHYLTGTSRGGDNFQRQELSDVGALVNPGFFEVYKAHPQAIGKLTHQLPDVYEHPSIFTAYPSLRKVNVQVANLGKASAQYDEVNKILTIDSGIMHNPRLVKEAIEHEITHEIQTIEGWEQGGNSEMFPSKKIAETAQFLEKIMQQYNVSAEEAAKMYKKQFLLPHKVDPQAIRYANELQGGLLPNTDPIERYQHIHGEIEAETPLGRSDLEQNQLQRFYPWEKDPKDVEGTLPQFTPDAFGRPRGRGAPIGVEPSNALYRSTRNPKGELVFSSKPKYYRMPIASATPVAQMEAELATKPEIQQSVKEKGGNWLDRTLNNHLRTLKQGINPSLAPDSFNLAPNWRDTANEIGFTPEHQEEFAKTAALNQFVDRRLSPYIKNEMGTPTDSVRDLADQGISHLQDLQFEPWISESTYDKRRAANMPTEGYAKNDAGKEWEMRTDEAIKNTKAGSAANSPASLEGLRNYPWVRPLANKNPNAPIHTMPNRDEFNELGFDHLMDELRSSITGNVPQHLALTIKDLERMTLPEAVRHVAKINEYREAQMSKTAAKSMEDFPAVKVYADKSKWHDLKLPEMSTELPEGYTVYEVHGTRWDAVKHEDVAQTAYNVRDDKGYATGNESYSPESSIKEFNEKHAYTKLDDVLKNEGKMMGHCVGNYTDEVASGNTKILTLRDKSNQPHATVEMNVVAPRWDELPNDVKGLPAEQLDQWIKDNPTVLLNQFKGKGNKPVIEKYRDQALDLLNNPPNIHMIYSITDEGRRDLAGAGIIDRNDTSSVLQHLTPAIIGSWGRGAEQFNKLIEQHPDLPRFISVDELKQLFKKQKPEGYKDGGSVYMAEGGDPAAMREALFEANRKAQAEKAAIEEATRPRTYAERLQDMGRLPTPEAPKSPRGSGGVGFVPGSRNPFNPDSPLNKKSGGAVHMAEGGQPDFYSNQFTLPDTSNVTDIGMRGQLDEGDYKVGLMRNKLNAADNTITEQNARYAEYGQPMAGGRLSGRITEPSLSPAMQAKVHLLNMSYAHPVGEGTAIAGIGGARVQTPDGTNTKANMVNVGYSQPIGTGHLSASAMRTLGNPKNQTMYNLQYRVPFKQGGSVETPIDIMRIELLRKKHG